MNIYHEIKNIIIQALEATKLDKPNISNLEVDIEKTSEAVTNSGDFTTTFALKNAKRFGMRPSKLADEIIRNISLDGTSFEHVNQTGAGFINFYLKDSWYSNTLNSILKSGVYYGDSTKYSGKRVIVEFVSANPTGPMHIGNARGGVLGDVIANAFRVCGAQVTKEFYLNDFGNQIDKFAESLEARYFQLCYMKVHGISADYTEEINGRIVTAWDIAEEQGGISFPLDGYMGDDIKDIAIQFYKSYGPAFVFSDVNLTRRREQLAKFGLNVNVPNMRKDLHRYNIDYDNWFYESYLHKVKYVSEVVNRLRTLGCTYEKDGALWLSTRDLLHRKIEELKLSGNKQDMKLLSKISLTDDVLQRSNGGYTYFASDIAYHHHKFTIREFDKAIDIWGADHYGHVLRLKLALWALGIDSDNRLDIVLIQLVKLMQDGHEVKISKRTGNTITLSNLLDDAPVDSVRWFFNSKADIPMLFDIGLANTLTIKNPVYYVQYAHARICSVFKSVGIEPVADAITLDGASSWNFGPYKKNSIESVLGFDITDTSIFSELKLDIERKLIKSLFEFSDVIESITVSYDTSILSKYLYSLATDFHKYYTVCRINVDCIEVRLARLSLLRAIQIVIRKGMSLLGINVMTKM